MKTIIFKLILAVGSVALISASTAGWAQGSLTPPGAPAPTMKSLDQIEPRIPIASVNYLISNPGSYYLTTNIVSSVPGGVNGITIACSDVNLDLNGFAIIGVDGTATGIQVSAIYVQGPQTNIAICNGTIKLWRYGLNAGGAYNSRFENVLLSTNGSFSLATGDNCTVKNCRATYFAAGGFLLGSNCYVADCAASLGGGYGFSATGATTFDHCRAYNNSSDGFIIGLSSIVTACASVGNGGYGFNAAAGAVVFTDSIAQTNSSHNFNAGGYCTLTRCIADGSKTGSGISVYLGNATECVASQNSIYGIDGQRAIILNCTVHNNVKAGIHEIDVGRVQGCHALENGLYGIVSDGGGLVEICQNNCAHNGTLSFGGAPTVGAGIYITNSPSCRLEGNTVTFNYTGLEVLNGLTCVILQNRASLNTSNYTLLSGNAWGPIVNISSVGDISGTANGNHPMANYSY